jgi:hypothetical protein
MVTGTVMLNLFPKCTALVHKADQDDSVKEKANMEEKVYGYGLDDTWGLSLVVPNSPLEIDVIRQVILPDRWDVVGETRIVAHAAVMTLPWEKGGQLIFHPQWSSKLVMHYIVGEILSDGVFNLTITLYDVASGSQIGALQLGVCLAIFGLPHDFQCSFREMKRSGFFHPQWGLLPDREPALGIKIKAQEGALSNPAVTLA